MRHFPLQWRPLSKWPCEDTPRRHAFRVPALSSLAVKPAQSSASDPPKVSRALLLLGRLIQGEVPKAGPELKLSETSRIWFSPAPAFTFIILQRRELFVWCRMTDGTIELHSKRVKGTAPKSRCYLQANTAGNSWRTWRARVTLREKN